MSFSEGPTMTRDWEDQYRRLIVKHEELKVAFNQQEDQIKKLQTKSRKLENDLTQSIIRSQTLSSNVSKPQEAIEDKAVDDNLKDKLNKMKLANTNLRERNKQLTEQLDKKTKEVTVVRRLLSDYKRNQMTKRDINSTLQDIEIKPAQTIRRKVVDEDVPETTDIPGPENLDSAENSDESILEIARRYKTRLLEAEDELTHYRNEVTRLRASVSMAPTATNFNTNQSHSPELTGMEGNLRDANWRLQQLQTQYDYLQSKSAAQASAYQRAEEQIEDYSQKMRDLRRSLEELRSEKAIADSKAMRVNELDETVQELRLTNKNLENRITKLCETPFISDAFAHQELQSMYQANLAVIEEYKVKISHLQEAVKTHFSALTSMKQQATQLREERDKAMQKMEETKMRFQGLEVGNAMLEDKLRIYSDGDGVDMESLERALTLVRRRGEALKKLPFLEDVDGESLLTVPDMKRKIGDLQMMNMKLAEEAEKFESMLKLQSSINKDLHSELETTVAKVDKDKRELLQRNQDFESIAVKRLEKIESLEAQLRQFVYGLNTSRKGAGIQFAAQDKDNMSALSVDDDNALLSELLDEQGNILKPGENVIEVWIKSAIIKPGIVGPGSSTFVVIDFFDYESQTTSLISGSKPHWDFGCTYKIVVDDFLLRYLALDTITLELNITTQGDFVMLARCTLPLAGLLRSKPVIKIQDYPLLSPISGEIIAHISVDIRLALPISELYRLFLQRHPTEKTHIEAVCSRRLVENAGLTKVQPISDILPLSVDENETRLYNELEISVVQATGLLNSRTNKSPTAYVVFQFLGNPEKFTNPVAISANPRFDETFVFPMITDDNMIRLMQRTKLLFLIMDVNDENIAGSNGGLLGEVAVSLQELAQGINLKNESYHIKSKEEKIIGQLELSICWKNPFRQARDLGPLALSGLDVEQLMSAFIAVDSTGTKLGGVINFTAFCRFADPHVEVKRTINNLTLMISTIQGRSPDLKMSMHDAVKELLDMHQNNITEDQFVEKLLQTRLDTSPLELIQLFQFCDVNADRLITTSDILQAICIDELPGIRSILQEKIRNQVAVLKSKNMSIYDFLGNFGGKWDDKGFVSRKDFKCILSRIGLILIDEPSGDHTSLNDVESENNREVLNYRNFNNIDHDDGDILNDTDSSEDILRIHSNSIRSASAISPEVTENIKARKSFEAHRHDLLQKSALVTNQIEKVPAAFGVNLLQETAINTDYIHHSHVESHAISQSTSNEPEGPQDNKYNADTIIQSKIRKNEYISDDIELPNLSASPLRRSINSNHVSAGGGERASTSLTTGPSDILAAEDTIRSFIASMQGHQPQPDFLSNFLDVDSSRSGYVSRAQFAHVITQHREIQLYGAELRACMDFFDASNDGTEINYEAFCRFTKWRPPLLISPIITLHSIVFHPGTILKFREYDIMGSGHLKRSDILELLNDMGYGQLPPTTVLDCMRIFETSQDGKVNYSNMVEYILENGLSAAVDDLAHELYKLLVPNESSALTDKAIRQCYKQIDTQMKDSFTVDELTQFLDDHGLFANREVVVGLYASIDYEHLGVRLNNFATWVRTYPTAARDTKAYYGLLSLSDIQKKLYAYLLLVSASRGTSLEELSSSFLVYDWRTPASGVITKSQFARALQRAGFPITKDEEKLLQTEFSASDGGNRVSYIRFLEWASPKSTEDAVSLVRSYAHLTKGSIRSPGSILKFLENSYRRGLDLLSIFSRYDSASVGRITVDDFCAALSDLGLATATWYEVNDMAYDSKCSAGDFVLYRRLISQLLMSWDEITKAESIPALELLRSLLQRSKADARKLRSAFEHYDLSDDGAVREEDLSSVFKDAGVKIRRSEMEAILEQYPLDISRSFPYKQMFQHYLSTMSDAAVTNNSKQNNRTHNLPDELGLKIREFLEDLILIGKDFRAEFDAMDENLVGSILQDDFKRVINDRLRGNFASTEMEKIVTVYRDAKDPRRVNHIRFIYGCHPRYFGNIDLQTHRNIDSMVWYNAELLRLKIRRRCDYASPGELKRPYRHFARTKGVAGVSLDDFRVALKDLGFRLSTEQELEIFKYFSPTQSNSLFHYQDFVVFTRDPFFQDVVWKLRRLMARSRTSIAEIETTLSKCQNLNTYLVKLVNSNQLSISLKSCNIELTQRDITRLVAKFDTDESDQVDVSLFIGFLRGSNELQAPEDGRMQPNALSNSKESIELAAFRHLREKVEQRMERGYSKNEIFSEFVDRPRGLLDLNAMQRGSRELGVLMSQAEARAVLRRMTNIAGGPIDQDSLYLALQISVSDKKKVDSSRLFSSRQIASNRTIDDSEVVDKIKSGDWRSERHGHFDYAADDDNLIQATEDEWESQRMENSTDEPWTVHDIIVSIRNHIINECERHNYRHKESSCGSKAMSPRTYFEDSLERSGVMRAGFIAQRELVRVLSDLNLNVSSRDVDEIFKEIEGSHNPSSTEFIKMSKLTQLLFSRSDAKKRRDVEEIKNASEVFSRRPDLLKLVLDNFTTIHAESGRTVDDLLLEMRRSDKTDSGRIKGKDFLKILTAFGFRWTKTVPDSSNALLDALSQADTNLSVDYEEFVTTVKQCLHNNQKKASTFHQNREAESFNTQQPSSINEVLELMCSQLDRVYGSRLNGLRELQKACFELDLDRGRLLNQHQMKTALAAVKIDIEIEDRRKLFRYFDPEGKDSISYPDVVAALQDGQVYTPSTIRDDYDSKSVTLNRMIPDTPSLEADRESLNIRNLHQSHILKPNPSRLISKLQNLVRKYWGSDKTTKAAVLQMYNVVDVKRVNDLSRRQLEDLLVRLRLDADLTEGEVTAFIDWFEANHNKTISLEGLLGAFNL